MTELRAELASALKSDSPMESSWNTLRAYKQKGISKEQMLDVLESLRKDMTDEAGDDRVLELMDFVAGFCAPHARLWDEG